MVYSCTTSIVTYTTILTITTTDGISDIMQDHYLQGIIDQFLETFIAIDLTSQVIITNHTQEVHTDQILTEEVTRTDTYLII